jgi:hypothetical protein
MAPYRCSSKRLRSVGWVSAVQSSLSSHSCAVCGVARGVAFGRAGARTMGKSGDDAGRLGACRKGGTSSPRRGPIDVDGSVGGAAAARVDTCLGETVANVRFTVSPRRQGSRVASAKLCFAWLWTPACAGVRREVDDRDVRSVLAFAGVRQVCGGPSGRLPRLPGSSPAGRVAKVITGCRGPVPGGGR